MKTSSYAAECVMRKNNKVLLRYRVYTSIINIWMIWIKSCSYFSSKICRCLFIEICRINDWNYDNFHENSPFLEKILVQVKQRPSTWINFQTLLLRHWFAHRKNFPAKYVRQHILRNKRFSRFSRKKNTPLFGLDLGRVLVIEFLVKCGAIQCGCA